MRMKPGHEAEWYDVCGNCAFFDGTQTHNHCCDIHIHTKLKNGSCSGFIYDRFHYGKDYGIDVLTENQIKLMTVGYPTETLVPLEGEQLSYTETDFSVIVDKKGAVSLWTEAGYGIKLSEESVRVLKRVIGEAIVRKDAESD